MSVLFINEENLPRVDALVVTDDKSVAAVPGLASTDGGAADAKFVAAPSAIDTMGAAIITVAPMNFMSNSRYAVAREVCRFLGEVLGIAGERGYTSLGMMFPKITNRKLIYEFLNTSFMEAAAGFDIDIYIIVDDRQKKMMRASLDIEDIIDPPMYCRKISGYGSVKPHKKSTRPRPSAAKTEMIEGECCSILEDDFFDESPSLTDFIRDMDDTFAVRLLKLIDKKGMSEVECYKAANVSRQTWYKIMNEKDYRPSKNTVICFAISLHLTYDETQALLATAGFILSGSILFDKIIAYCIREGNYDIFSINAMLYSYDAECLGA